MSRRMLRFIDRVIQFASWVTAHVIIVLITIFILLVIIIVVLFVISFLYYVVVGEAL